MKFQDLKPGQKFRVDRSTDNGVDIKDVISHDFIRLWAGYNYTTSDGHTAEVKAVSIVDGRPIWFTSNHEVVLI